MILDEIVENTRRKLETRKLKAPLEKVQRLALKQTLPVDLAAALNKKKSCLIL